MEDNNIYDDWHFQLYDLLQKYEEEESKAVIDYDDVKTKEDFSKWLTGKQEMKAIKLIKDILVLSF